MPHARIAIHAGSSAAWRLRAACIGLLAALAAGFGMLAAAPAASALDCTPSSVTLPPANAPLPGSCFEGFDGDHVDPDGAPAPGSSNRLDWESLKSGDYGTDFNRHDDYTIGADDSQFGPGGAEEQPDTWTFTAKTGIGAAKYDAVTAWTFREPNFEDGSADLFLAMAFIRASTSGETHLSFELNQRPPGYRTATEEVDPPATPRTIKVPTRSSGDLLITYSVSNNINSAPPRIGMCKWVGGASSGSWTTMTGIAVGNGECPQLNSTVSQASMNLANITAEGNFLTGAPLQAGRFGEAAVNLTESIKAALGTPSAENVCSSFGYVWMHSRSAPSITSNQQDYILPEKTITVANCAVSGVKFHDLNGDGTRQTSGPDAEPLLGGWKIFADYDDDGTLDNDLDATLEPGEEPYDVTSDGISDPRDPGSYLISNIKPGTWKIREELKAGWACTTPTGCAYEVEMTGELVPGKDFGNWQAPKVEVVKQTTPDTDTTTDFGFTSTLPGGNFTLTGDGDTTGAITTGAGAYTVTESSVGTDYDFSNASCTGTDTGTTWSLSATTINLHMRSGDDLVCSFYNTQRGATSGVKYHDLDGDGTQDGGEPGLAGFRIYADLDGDDNHDDGTGADPAEPISAVTDSTGAWSIGGLVAGDYTLRETGPSGYACTDPSTTDPAPASTSASCEYDITVTAGGSVPLLKFGNWIPPKVAIVKNTVPDTDTTTAFDFTSDLPGGNFTLTGHGADTGVITTGAGAFQVAESPENGWDLTAASCTGTDTGTTWSRTGNRIDLDMQSGDALTCTFVNTEQGSVTGVKYEDLDGDGTRDPGEPGLGGIRIYADISEPAGAYTAGEPTAVSDATTGEWTITGIPGGDVSIREDLTPAQAADGWQCTDPSTADGAPASAINECAFVVSVPAGGQYAETLRFGNWIPPKVEIVKDTDPSTDATPFAFTSTLPGNAGFSLAHGQSTGALTPGAGEFTVSETDPTPAHDLARITCTGTDRGAGATTSGLTATVRLESRDDVTCTFFNVERGSASGVKYEDLDGNGTQDGGETGVGGFRIYADLDGDNGHDAASEPSAVSAADGTWTIAGIPAGDVSIREALTAAQVTAGWVCTEPDAAADCESDVTVPAGGEVAQLKFGNWIPPRVNVVKNTVPGTDTTTAFGFTSDLPGGDFTLTGHGDETGAITTGAGPYSITESTVGAGYDLTDAACTGTDGGTTWSRTGARIDVHMRSGDDLTCTFTNTKQGSVAGVKYHDLDGDGTRDAGEPGLAGFTIYVDADGDGTRDAGERSDESGVDGVWSIGAVPAGTRTLREDLTAAQTTAGWTCTDPAGACAQDVDVPAGGTAGDRLFGNWVPPRVDVAKTTDPAGDTTSTFGFTTDIPGSAAFSLKDAETLGAKTVDAGDYAITESDDGAGYTLDDIACTGFVNGSVLSDAEPTVGVRLRSQDDVTCTFTNKKDATVKVTKSADPADGTDFDFSGSFGAFKLDDGGDVDATKTSETFTVTGDALGEKSVTEADSAGWTLTGIACNAAAGLVKTGSTATLDVDAGDQIECTFTNRKDATVKVTKSADPADGTDFGFTGTLGAFKLDDGGSADATKTTEEFTLTAADLGTKTITETATDGWDLTALTCDDDDFARNGATATIDVEAGEAIECTFTNTKRGTIEIEKVTDPVQTGGATFAFTATGLAGASDLAAAGFDVAAGATKTIADVVPNPTGDAYTVTEGDAPGYRLTGVACVDPTEDSDRASSTSRTASIRVSPGETVKCTFTNLRLAASQLVIKEGAVRAHHGDQVTYTFAVQNTGNSPLQNVKVTDDKCAPVSAAPTEKRNDDGNATLDAVGADGTSPETWVFSCTRTLEDHAAGEQDPVRNTATATADDEQGNPVAPATDVHDTDILHPSIAIDKKVRAGGRGDFADGPVSTYVGERLDYRFTVANTGDTPLTVTQFDDPRCDAGTLAGPTRTGGDDDALLEVGETWTYTCSRVVTAGDGDPVRNVVTVTATDELGGEKGTVTATDRADADVWHPAVSIDKTGPATATVGDRVSFTLAVTNPGDVPLVGQTLAVTDNRCEAPPALVAKARGTGADPTPDTLDPGDTWGYACTAQTQAGQSSFVNTASVTGFDPNGRRVDDSDDHTVALGEVAPVVVRAGAAQLRGPSACVSRKFKLRIRGKRIRRVIISIDGKRVKVFRNRAGEGRRFTYTVDGRRYSLSRVHRVRARILFARDSRTRPRTLRLTFARCVKQVVKPVFTG